MNAISLRYGLYAATFLSALHILDFWWGQGQEPDYAADEVFGYLTLFLSMIFVYFGIRKYRDQEAGGYLEFWEGIKLGALIIILPSLAFGLYSLIYSYWLDPGFMEAYFNQNLENLRAELPAAEYAIKEKELLAQKDTFMNPFFNFGLMFLTVYIIGIIASIISSFALLKNRPIAEA